jgi:hypothetical protein
LFVNIDLIALVNCTGLDVGLTCWTASLSNVRRLMTLLGLTIG